MGSNRRGGLEFFDGPFCFGKARFGMGFAVAADGKDLFTAIHETLNVGIGGLAFGWILAGVAEAVETTLGGNATD
ncbi:hypothetical protein [Pedosphaera parvula]|uniref:Uncharacterized protein n=1 Tax=Pedosphaera parvula (strain Ellin514) TaxID=320771 RepID=B9XLQ2_PEDPL|nr:hypothetical protein [Pedosphaera parvula]EEF59300.1 hypothetical protein Cflav_PD2151 [Pedosphaera parvula Ellin514]